MLLRCNINTGVHARTRGVDVLLRDVTVARDEKWSYRVRVTSRTGNARRILGIWRKLVELRTGHRTRRLTFAGSRRHWAGVARDGGGRWKGQNRKIVPPSLYVEKPLNSKVIKGFVPELRNRKCFSCFEIPMFYTWTLYVHFAYSCIWLCKSWLSHSRLKIWYLMTLCITLDRISYGSKVSTAIQGKQ